MEHSGDNKTVLFALVAITESKLRRAWKTAAASGPSKLIDSSMSSFPRIKCVGLARMIEGSIYEVQWKEMCVCVSRVQKNFICSGSPAVEIKAKERFVLEWIMVIACVNVCNCRFSTHRGQILAFRRLCWFTGLFTISGILLLPLKHWFLHIF